MIVKERLERSLHTSTRRELVYFCLEVAGNRVITRPETSQLGNVAPAQMPRIPMGGLCDSTPCSFDLPSIKNCTSYLHTIHGRTIAISSSLTYFSPTCKPVLSNYLRYLFAPSSYFSLQSHEVSHRQWKLLGALEQIAAPSVTAAPSLWTSQTRSPIQRWSSIWRAVAPRAMA